MNYAERAGKLPSRLALDTLFQIVLIVIRSPRLLFPASKIATDPLVEPLNAELAAA
jgi:hypothetical protein